MTTFHFRLQTVLKLRITDRQQRQLQLAEALTAEQLLNEQLVQIAAELEQLRSAIRRWGKPGVVDVNELINANRYELVLRARKVMRTQQHSQLSAEVQRRRQALVEADRQVRVLEKLREGKFATFQHQELLQEIKLLDEIGQRGQLLNADETC